MKALRLLLLVTVFPLSFLQAQDEKNIERMTQNADSLYHAGKVEEALSLSDRIIGLARESGDVSMLTDCYTSRGVYLRSSGKLKEAAEAYGKALEYAAQANPDAAETQQSLATLYTNLSALYLDMKNPRLSTDYAVKAVELADRCSDKSLRSQIYSVCSSVFITQKQHDLARKYLLKAINLARDMKQTDAELSALTYYLLVLQRTGSDNSEMKPYAERADQLADRTSSVMGRINYYQIIFYICQTQKLHSKAIQVAEKMLAVKEIKNYPFIQQDFYNNLHLLYKEKGAYRLAYETLDKAKLLGDSLFAAEKSRQIEELSVKYETQKKETEIKELNIQREKAQRYIVYLISALSVVVLLAFLVGAYLLQSRKLRTERLKRENETRERQFEQLLRSSEQKLIRKYLKELEDEQTRLAKELHDGVCNDLYALEINLEKEKTSCADLCLRTLRESRENIRNISHKLLPPLFKEATIEQVLAGYIDTVSGAKCRINLVTLPEDCDWSVLPETFSLNIYRIVQEAVGNALKHTTASQITVTLAWKLPNLEISICNNGKPAGGGNKGIGMRTMKERANALKAQLLIETTAQNTTVRIVIPVF